MSDRPPAAPVPANTCDVLSLLRSGTAFAPAVVTQANNVLTSITALTTNLSTGVDSLIALGGVVAGSVVAVLQSVISTLTTVVTSAINALIGHVQQQVSNLVRQLAVAITDLSNRLGLQQAGCAPAGTPDESDPCGGIGEFFGLLGNIGAGILSSITSQLSSLFSGAGSLISDVLAGALAGVNDALAAISGVMSTINGLVSDITNGIANEAARLVSAITDNLTVGNAFALNGLFRNPCARGVIQSAASPQLLTALG